MSKALPTVFYLARSAYDQIVTQAKQGFPYEVCGFLGGLQTGSGQVVRAATNVSSHPSDAYDIAPEETLAALLEFESHSYQITGIYHSHPNYPARPSNTDLRLADMPNVCYLIISVQSGGSDFKLELKAYQILAAKAHEVRLELTD